MTMRSACFGSRTDFRWRTSSSCTLRCLADFDVVLVRNTNCRGRFELVSMEHTSSGSSCRERKEGGASGGGARQVGVATRSLAIF